jgi:hypothetical protein
VAGSGWAKNYNAVNKNNKIVEDEVLFDNQADISIIHPRLLRQVKESEDQVKVNGVGGPQLVVNKAGFLPDFFEVYTSEETKANEIPKGAEILSSHMFVVDMFEADGSYDKTKARLVTHGNEQNAALYPTKLSPTVAIHSLFTVMALYAGQVEHQMAKVYIKGAFIQTPMTGAPVYMKISRNVVKYVVELFPDWGRYIMKDGIMYARMLKAMYGCV